MRLGFRVWFGVHLLLNWVALKELDFSEYNGGTLVFDYIPISVMVSDLKFLNSNPVKGRWGC